MNEPFFREGLPDEKYHRHRRASLLVKKAETDEPCGVTLAKIRGAEQALEMFFSAQS